MSRNSEPSHDPAIASDARHVVREKTPGMPSPQIGRNTRELRDAKLLTCRLLQRLLECTPEPGETILSDSTRKLGELLDSLSMLQPATNARHYLRSDLETACRQALRVLRQPPPTAQPGQQPMLVIDADEGPADPELLGVLLAIARAQLELGAATSIRIALDGTDAEAATDTVAMEFAYEARDKSRPLLGRDGMHFVHNFLFGTGGAHRISVQDGVVRHELTLPTRARETTRTAPADINSQK